MSKRKATVHNVALELARERLACAKLKHDVAYQAIGSGAQFNKTEEDFYHNAVEFVLRARKAQW